MFIHQHVTLQRLLKKKKSNTSHIVSVLRGKGVDFFYNNSTNILKFKAPTKKENQ